MIHKLNLILDQFTDSLVDDKNIGIVLGILSGVISWVTLDYFILDGMLKMLLSGIAAFTFGFLGAMGKYFFDKAKTEAEKKYKTWRKGK